MGWFRRSRGRHALGAPKRVVEAVVVPAVVVPAFVPMPVASDLSFFAPGSAAVMRPASEPTELVVPVAVGAVAPPTHLAEPTPAVDTDDVLSSIAALIVSGEAWVESPVVPGQRAVPVVAAPPRAMTFASPPVAVAQLPVPPMHVEDVELPAAEYMAAPPVSRVQLGFRDGTTASLDPDSEQAAALEELALLLSLRD